MSRPLLRILLLTLAVLLAQLGGLTHALSHHHEDADQPPACELCAAYAAFDHALPGIAPTPLAVAVQTPTHTPLFAGSGQPLSLPYRPRAPPPFPA